MTTTTGVTLKINKMSTLAIDWCHNFLFMNTLPKLRSAPPPPTTTTTNNNNSTSNPRSKQQG